MENSTKGKVLGKWKQIKSAHVLLLSGFVEGCWNPTMFISKDANVVWSLSYVLWFHGVGDWKSQGKQCSFPSWKNTRQVGAVKTLVYYTYVFFNVVNICFQSIKKTPCVWYMFIYIAIETASFLAGINDGSQVFFKRSSPSLKKKRCVPRRKSLPSKELNEENLGNVDGSDYATYYHSYLRDSES